MSRSCQDRGIVADSSVSHGFQKDDGCLVVHFGQRHMWSGSFCLRIKFHRQPKRGEKINNLGRNSIQTRPGTSSKEISMLANFRTAILPHNSYISLKRLFRNSSNLSSRIYSPKTLTPHPVYTP